MQWYSYLSNGEAMETNCQSAGNVLGTPSVDQGTFISTVEQPSFDSARVCWTLRLMRAVSSQQVIQVMGLCTHHVISPWIKIGDDCVAQLQKDTCSSCNNRFPSVSLINDDSSNEVLIRSLIWRTDKRAGKYVFHVCVGGDLFPQSFSLTRHAVCKSLFRLF